MEIFSSLKKSKSICSACRKDKLLERKKMLNNKIDCMVLTIFFNAPFFERAKSTFYIVRIQKIRLEISKIQVYLKNKPLNYFETDKYL